MRSLRWARAAATGALMALVGCFSPNYGEMAFTCGDDGACPSGYTCKADNRCYRRGGPEAVDAATGDGTSAADAASIDGMVVGDGGVADAMVDAVVPDADPCAPDSLLVDGDFDATENNNADWDQTSTLGLPLIYDDALVPESSPNHVWLCGYTGPGTDIIEQTVTVAADGGKITISGYYQVRSPGQNDSDDVTTIEITNAAGDSVLETLQAFTGATDVTTWTPFSFQSSANYGGQTVGIRLRCDLDSDMRTISFYYDTVQAMAESCVL